MRLSGEFRILGKTLDCCREVRNFCSKIFNLCFLFIGTLFCISVLSKKMQIQDSAIGVLAGMSRIAACLVFAFAPSRPWYYSAPLFNIFSHTGLIAIRSLASKSVPLEEVGK